VQKYIQCFKKDSQQLLSKKEFGWKKKREKLENNSNGKQVPNSQNYLWQILEIFLILRCN
jgi:hypothetical protein